MEKNYYLCFEQVRLATFANWRHLQPSAEWLAALGFYFTQSQDRVKCSWCGLGLTNFEPTDNPAKMHRTWSGKCKIADWTIPNIGMCDDPLTRWEQYNEPTIAGLFEGVFSAMKHAEEVPEREKPQLVGDTLTFPFAWAHMYDNFEPQMLSVLNSFLQFEQIRLATYLGSRAFVEFADSLARCGFYFVKSEGRPRCIYCNISVEVDDCKNCISHWSHCPLTAGRAINIPRGKNPRYLIPPENPFLDVFLQDFGGRDECGARTGRGPPPPRARWISTLWIVSAR